MQGRRNQPAATDSRNERRFRGGEYVANLMAELNRLAIAQRVQQAREEAGLKQREVAEALQVHWRTVQNWESQANPIVAWDRLDELSDLLGVSKPWLIHGEETIRETNRLADRLEALEEKVADGFEAIEAAIEQLAEQLRHRDVR